MLYSLNLFCLGVFYENIKIYYGNFHKSAEFVDRFVVVKQWRLRMGRQIATKLYKLGSRYVSFRTVVRMFWTALIVFSGEPNSVNSSRSEDCVEMYWSSGQWNDANCQAQNPYICKVNYSNCCSIYPKTCRKYYYICAISHFVFVLQIHALQTQCNSQSVLQ